MGLSPDAMISAVLLGLLGSGHCLAMCGGLSSALGLNTDSTGKLVLGYHVGRIISYGLAGILVGILGLIVGEQLQLLTSLRYAAAIMLILIGIYIAQWFNTLLLIEKLGTHLWHYIQPLGKRFLRPKNLTQAIFLGMVWGWLPCGLVYSALVYASTQASLSSAFVVMVLFGLSTLPSMLSLSFLGMNAKHWLGKAWFRKTSGSLLIIYGCWSLYELLRNAI